MNSTTAVIISRTDGLIRAMPRAQGERSDDFVRLVIMFALIMAVFLFVASAPQTWLHKLLR